MKTKAPVMTIQKPLRKWQHATMEIEVPPGWELNYEWGRYAPVRDLEVCTNADCTISKIVVGLRRSKYDAVEVTNGKKQEVGTK